MNWTEILRRHLKIRKHFSHGVGSRIVRISRDGWITISGYPDPIDWSEDGLWLGMGNIDEYPHVYSLAAEGN